MSEGKKRLITCVAIGFVFAVTITLIVGESVDPNHTLGIWLLASGAVFYYTYTRIDSKYYGLAEQELNDGTIDQGLWAKSLVQSKGNEYHRKAEYIKLRAKQLQKNSK